jgi:hypothetical protein
MRLASLSTPFAATSGAKTRQAQTLEAGRFYISSKKTRRTSTDTIWLRPHTAISARKRRVGCSNFSSKKQHALNRLTVTLCDVLETTLTVPPAPAHDAVAVPALTPTEFLHAILLDGPQPATVVERVHR